VELGLSYLAEVAVIVLAEPLGADADAVVRAAASYHGARLVAVIPPGTDPTPEVAAAGTVLQAPGGDARPFHALVGRYAVGLAQGQEPRAAFEAALRAGGWEHAPA
jgi:hypothetical protein